MKKPVSIQSPGQLTVLAALLAGLCAPALAASDIVISQVYGGGGNASAPINRDYIELFNRGTAAVNISGWSVQYASSAGTSWTNKTVLGTVTLDPGKYYLIGGAGGTTGVAPPTPDASGSINMSASAGKVALVNNGTTLGAIANPAGTAGVIDVVSFGGSTPTEGTPTPALSNTTAALRNGAGCSDTDVNSADFSVGAPAPRNSGTAANVCGGGGGEGPPATNDPIAASCPAFSVVGGTAGSGIFTASDPDSIVNSAVISSGGFTGITLGALTNSPNVGQNASVSLNVAASVPVGSYPIGITFGNNSGQTATCSSTVTVQAEAAVTFTIPQIQGSGKLSTHTGVQTTEGVITMKLPNGGFFIQDPAGDGDANTSDALYVFGTTTTAQVNDRVRVTGTVTNYQPGGASAHAYTEMGSVTAIKNLGAAAPIAPTDITMPMDLMKVEGMLVRFINPLVINDVGQLGERGEMTLSSARHEVPTNRYRPGVMAQTLAAANLADQIILDDTIFSTPQTVPYVAADKTVRAGDTVNGLVGVVDYGSIGNSNYAFKLQPTSVAGVSIDRTNPRTLAPTVAAGNVRVASANVLNFFTTFTNGTAFDSTATTNGCSIGTSGSVTKGNCRGADNLDEFVRQRTKIVNELMALNADVVGLMEIQNNGNVAVQHLVDTLNTSLGGPVYAAVGVPSFTGTDAIRVAMIYKPAAVTPYGAPIADPDTVINDRPPLAQTFKAANGAKFSVIVNHLKSKRCSGASGANADKFDGQGCFNGDRILQTQRLRNTFIPQVVAAAGDPDVLIIGDFNSHGFEDPIDALTGDGYMVNQLERFQRPRGLVYSYVFDSEAGYLDHAMTTAAFNSQVVDATEWHNNADEPEVIDYNKNLGTSTTVMKPNDLYEANAYRASDHDPVVISLNLTATYNDITSSFNVTRSGIAANRATGQYGGTYSFTNKTGAAITGPFHIEVGGLPANVTLSNATGMHNGVPYIDAAAGSLAPGATATVTLLFGNPNKVAINYAATILTGTF